MSKAKNRNFWRFALSLVLTATFCVPFFAAPPSANAGIMKWTTVDTPDTKDYIIVSPSELNAMAIGLDGITLYAIDTSQSKVYKSTNGGISWIELTNYLTSAGAVLPAWNIAVAQDNPNFVVVVTSAAGLPRKVFVSADGGANWQDAKCPATNNISVIDISKNYGNYDITVGTRTGAGTGTIYNYKAAGPVGSWATQGLIGDIVAAKFSPNYRIDAAIAIVYSDMTGTRFTVGIRDLTANTTNWAVIYGATPPEITTGVIGSSPKANQIITADLELPLDFSGQAPSSCRCYISLDAPAANAGIFRIDRTIVYLLMPASPTKRISSIAYYGTYDAGKLLAGEVLGDPAKATVMVWFTDAPNACPNTCWYPTQKPPTGAGNSGYGNAQVFWSPDSSRAYCITSSALLNNSASWPGSYLVSVALDESALSLTLDNGKTWNQLSMIDTEISFLSDVVVPITSDTIYLASINNHAGINNFDSIWRSTSLPPGRNWERVLCLLSTTNDIIIRMSDVPNDPSVFFASRSTSDLRQSPDRGQTWTSTFPNVNVTDFAVIRVNNIPNIYVLDNNYIRKGTGTAQAWQWGQRIDTTLSSGHNINVTPTGVIAVGDNGEGVVAYSLDGGTHFVRTPPIFMPGQVHVIADYRFRNYLIIYAASNNAGSEIYNWLAISNFGWTAMGPPGRSFYGLAQISTLYGAWANVGNTAVDRTLEPEKLGAPNIEWDSLNVGLTAGVIFTREPVSLKASAGINLWAIDNRPYTASTGRLWNFCDCLAPSPQFTPPPPPSRDILFQTPTAISPSIDDVIPIYVETGKIGDITFKWQHPTQVMEYELWLAKDTSFSQIIAQQTIALDNRRAPIWTLPRTTNVEPGKTYYWKVRVTKAATGETGNGEWSKIMSFSVASLPPQESPYPGPTLLTPAKDATNIERSPLFSWTPLPGAKEYELILARDAELRQIFTRARVTNGNYKYNDQLDWNTTYYWQVKATEPFTSQPSSVFSFTVTPKAEPPLRITNLPLWLWVIIALLIAILIIVVVIIKAKPSIFKKY